MSSSISASEAWRRWLKIYAAATLLVGLTVAAAILAIDPYDTGRFALLPARGVPNFGQRLSFASIAREPGVDSAVFGNSSIQLLDPARLSEETGRRFVSLAVPGTGPLEQMAIADWFRRRHAGEPHQALVFGLDSTWCTTERPIPIANPFPFWLYGGNWADYAINVLRYKSIEASVRKVKMLWGDEPQARRDGYHDYDTGHDWHESDTVHDDVADREARSVADITAVPLLRHLLKKFGPGTTTALVMVPRHASALPHDAAEAASLSACKSAYRSLAAETQGALFLDFLVDSAMTRDDGNFWDTVHYRGAVARALEHQIAAALGPSGQGG